MDSGGRIEENGASESEGEAGESEGAAGGSRSRKRDSLFLSARVRVGTEVAVHEARVRNLSVGGLMVELDRGVEPGTPVLLEMRGLGELTGTVAWYTRGRLGIALDHPIDPARARKPIGTGKSAPGHVKPLVIPNRRA